MNLNQYDPLFEEFILNIVLTKSQTDIIDQSLMETLSLFAAEYSSDVEIYAQGSYAMGTTVRPLTANQSLAGIAGEYDIDIVLERTTWTDAVSSLASVRNVLSDEYSEKLDSKLRESCERVLHKIDRNTEVAFHVDYVPIKLTHLGRSAARRSTNNWFSSDTKKLVEWFSWIADEQVFLPSIILMIKRMRDYSGLTDTLSSICITALVCDLYEKKLSYAEDLLDIIDGIIKVFNVPHTNLTIKIEPLADDLANKIDGNQQKSILNYFVKARKDLQDGFAKSDLVKIRSVLSGAFPSDIDEFPENLESLRKRGWGIETDGSLSRVEIQETAARGTHVTRLRRKFFGTGEKLIFKANEVDYDKSNYGIRWQVLNSKGSPRPRGNLFEAKSAGGGKNSNEFVNHETEQYDGEHWIKYYIYSKSTRRVVEIGEKFFVEVENR